MGATHTQTPYDYGARGSKASGVRIRLSRYTEQEALERAWLNEEHLRSSKIKPSACGHDFWDKTCQIGDVVQCTRCGDFFAKLYMAPLLIEKVVFDDTVKYRSNRHDPVRFVHYIRLSPRLYTSDCRVKRYTNFSPESERVGEAESGGELTNKSESGMS